MLIIVGQPLSSESSMVSLKKMKKNDEWKWWVNENKNKFLERVIIYEKILVGLIGVDNNLRWERPMNMIKLCGFYKCWDNNGVLLINISNTVI